MRFAWDFDAGDVRKIKDFVEALTPNPLVVERRRRNLAAEKPPVSRARLWEVMVACLLTSQQRSGPKSAVSNLLNVKPYPFRLEFCEGCDLAVYAKKILEDFGGIRFTNRIPTQLAANLPLMTGAGWDECLGQLEALRTTQTKEVERATAGFFDERFAGLGPKQARNVLQLIGLTRYEVPIDSRIVKWMKAAGFPMPLSSALLQDLDYYLFVEDAFQALCDACGIFPCVLDASIFASYDGNAWTDELATW